MLRLDQATDPPNAQLAKGGNSLRVMTEVVRWDKRGARINTNSPVTICSPRAKDELTGPGGYRHMIKASPPGRGRTPE